MSVSFRLTLDVFWTFAEDCIIHAIHDLEEMEDVEVDDEIKLPKVGAVKAVHGVSQRPTFFEGQLSRPPRGYARRSGACYRGDVG